MTTIAKMLPTDVRDILGAAEAALRDFVTQQHDARADKSEKWHESFAGEAHYAWLEELDQLVSALEEVSLTWEAR